jgi:iron complex outermembrane receptor protein
MKALKAVMAAGATILLADEVARAKLEEIVVTATRRTESLQDVPVSVTVLTGEAIRQGGFSDLEDISAFVPNLFMRDMALGQRLYIRGIGTSPINEAFEQAVAQFVDGVYYGRDNLGQNALFDLERIEVARGPQPTFAGQSATAGALNVITRRPGEDLDGQISLAYGSDEETSMEFAIGGPVSDTFGLRFAGRYYELDDTGYFRISDGQPMGIKENQAARITGAWNPTDNFELTFKYENQDIWQLGIPFKFTDCDLDPATSLGNPQLSAGMPAMCALDILYAGIDHDPGNPFEARLGAMGGGGSVDIWDAVEALDTQFGLTPGARTAGGVSFTPVECAVNNIPGCSPVARGLNVVREFNEEETREFDADVFSVDFDWQITDRLLLTAISSLVEQDKQDWLDPDRSTIAIGSAVRKEHFEQKAQEIRLSSSRNQMFEWMVGVYYQDHELDALIDIYIPRILGPPAGVWTLPGSISIGFGSRLIEDSTWTSAFFAGTWNINEAFRINIGARYQEVDKRGELTPTVASLLAGATEYTPFGPYPGGVRPPFAGLNADGDDRLPEVGFQWDVAGRLMLYGKYAEAFKAGGFILAPAPAGNLPNPPDYGAEFAEGIEFGLKGRFLDNNLELNFSWYDTDYTDLQVTVFDAQTSSSLTQNAGAANTRGIELDGRWAGGDNFTMGFSGSLSDAKYERYAHANTCNSLVAKLFEINTRQRAANCTVDLSGARMPFAPDWTVGITPRLDFLFGSRLIGSFMANLFFTGDYFNGNGRHPISFVEPHHRLDLRFALAPVDGSWQVAFYGRNVTDEEIVSRVGENRFHSRSLALDYDAAGGSIGRGARYGIQLSYFFGRN